MKIIKLSAIVFSAIFMLACSGNQKETEKTETESSSDYNNMIQVQLNEFGVDASMYIPDENKGKAEIEKTPYGSVEIRVGDNFGLEVVPFGQSKAEFKVELEGDLVYEVEYLEEDDHLLFYKRSIKDSDMEPEFHFFLEKKINGEIYEVKSLADMSFKENAVKEMLKSAKSIETKPMS